MAFPTSQQDLATILLSTGGCCSSCRGEMIPFSITLMSMPEHITLFLFLISSSEIDISVISRLADFSFLLLDVLPLRVAHFKGSFFFLLFELLFFSFSGSAISSGSAIGVMKTSKILFLLYFTGPFKHEWDQLLVRSLIVSS